MKIVPKGAVSYGIDLGKSTFHVVGVDRDGAPIQRIKLNRNNVLQFFTLAKEAKIGMEACPGSQWLARKLRAIGHRVFILPAQFVKPFVKSNKNDIIDAEAIVEALNRSTMRFVQIKTEIQSDLQAIHRIRDNVVAARTKVVCQARAFCLEYGIGMRPSVGAFRKDIAKVLSDESNDLTPMMRGLLRDLVEDFNTLDQRLENLNKQIASIAARDDQATRLATIPGIGLLTATALVSAIGNAVQFKKARDLSAWLGLVPAQHSTGGKTTLGSISKRGNAYIRRLLIHGARSVILHLDRDRSALGRWIDSLEQRVCRNKIVVAIANKIARIAWVISRNPGSLYLEKSAMPA